MISQRLKSARMVESNVNIANEYPIICLKEYFFINDFLEVLLLIIKTYI